MIQIQCSTKSGPSLAASATPFNGVSAFRWRTDDGPTVNAGLVAL